MSRKNNTKEFKQLFILLDTTSFRTEDKKSANDFFLEDETALAIDTIITQLYEYHVKINKDIYNKIRIIAKGEGIQETSFNYLKELIV